MKYIITESQLNLLRRGIPIWVTRRANEEYLISYIHEGELAHLNPCDDFYDEYEWIDQVIDYAIDKLLAEVDNDIDSKDYYSDVMDFLRQKCRDLFGDYLHKIYKETCS